MDFYQIEMFKYKQMSEELLASLQVVLDCVDYTSGACGMVEPVGGVLPKAVIEKARFAIAFAKENHEI